MKPTCDIVRDLLPLYLDEVCSESSRLFVKEHMENCAECAGVFRNLQNDSLQKTLEEEKALVVANQAKVFRRKSATVGAVLAGIMLIPILVCLIVNIAVGHALDWFFIVLTALMVFASLTVVPLAAPSNRGFWTLTAFTGSLLVLLGACCIYTSGDWFFVTASSSLFGLAICFLPFAVRGAPLRRILGSRKGLFVMAVDTVLFYLMLFFIGLYVQRPEYWQLAFAISCPFVVLAWLLFVVLRYLKVRKRTKVSFCCLLCFLLVFFGDKIIGTLLFSGASVPLPVFHPLRWDWITWNDNLKWLALIISGLSAVLLGMDELRHKMKERKLK